LESEWNEEVCTLQQRFDQLNISAETFACVAQHYGPLRPDRARVSNWLNGLPLSANLTRQFEAVLLKLETFVAWMDGNGEPHIDMTDGDNLIRALKLAENDRNLTMMFGSKG
jgi:hypothetical protein